MAIAYITSDGQLADAKGTLHTMTDPGMARVSLVNTDSSTRTINVYVNRGGTSRLVSPENMSLLAGAKWISDAHSLGAGDLVEGDASVANVVDYVVSGFEQS